MTRSSPTCGSCARRRVHAGTEEAVEKQHAKGKLTARERIAKLLDPGSVEELDTFVRHRTHEFGMDKRRPYGDAVVTGYGTIDGRTVFVFSQTSRSSAGRSARVMAEKMVKVMDLAAKVGAPRDRHQRLGRRADPGGGRLARRLRRRPSSATCSAGRDPARSA